MFVKEGKNINSVDGRNDSNETRWISPEISLIPTPWS